MITLRDILCMSLKRILLLVANVFWRLPHLLEPTLAILFPFEMMEGLI